MFICAVCKKAISPRISPVIVAVSTRQVQYEHTDPESGDVSFTPGTEIEREATVCPTCVGMKIADAPVPDMSKLILLAKGMQNHAKGCKKILDDCRVCADNMAEFAVYPAQILSRVLEDRKIPTLEATLGAMALEKMLRRAEETDKSNREKFGSKASKNSGRSFAAAYHILDGYQKRGGVVRA